MERAADFWPKAEGVIGVTDDGYPIVTGGYACPYWQPGASLLFEVRECWYCKHADFRKTARITLQKSICRNPRCRIVAASGIPPLLKNEAAESEKDKEKE